MAKKKQATKLCYVIMPFSDTDSCTEGQWTTIFNGLIKPAVEDAGLGYKCVRSKATTGNLIKKIVQDLYSANVVIADLTDKKANVFYELGVRHTIRHRTILIAQRRPDIPSDLDGYASHEYDWNTEPGQQQFRTNIRDSLEHIEEDPDRSDNPVSDFLRERSYRIMEFQREENSLKLRALIDELDVTLLLLSTAIKHQPDADKVKAVVNHPCPALDHLIATQYLHHEFFALHVRTLRSRLAIIGEGEVSREKFLGTIARTEVVKRNAKKLLAAYEAGDPLDSVELEGLPSSAEK